MTKKVKVAVFDQDLKIRKAGEYELTDNGSKIQIKSGGEANWNPRIGVHTHLDFERRRWYPPFTKFWERMYFVRNKSKKCVDFMTEEVTGPDADYVLDAAGIIMLNKLGDQKQETPIVQWLMVALLGIILLMEMGVLR